MIIASFFFYIHIWCIHTILGKHHQHKSKESKESNKHSHRRQSNKQNRDLSQINGRYSQNQLGGNLSTNDQKVEDDSFGK